MSFKTRLKEARQSKKMTQKDLAELIGVAKSTYAGYETGNSEPDMDKIIKIISILQIDSNFLFQDEMNSTTQPEPATSDIGLETITDCYNSMNPDGQQRLVEQAELLRDSGKYQKTAYTEKVV